jgi:hypothetical protein
MTTRVYRYGLLPPIENVDLVHEQMRLAHQYQNTLTEIERERRAAVRAATAIYPSIEALTAEVAAAEAVLEAALGIVKDKRRGDRRRSETDIDKQRIKGAREALAAIRLTLRDTRREIAQSPEVQAAFAAAEERCQARNRAARGACGVISRPVCASMIFIRQSPGPCGRSSRSRRSLVRS